MKWRYRRHCPFSQANCDDVTLCWFTRWIRLWKKRVIVYINKHNYASATKASYVASQASKWPYRTTKSIFTKLKLSRVNPQCTFDKCTKNSIVIRCTGLHDYTCDPLGLFASYNVGQRLSCVLLLCLCPLCWCQVYMTHPIFCITWNEIVYMWRHGHCLLVHRLASTVYVGIGWR